MHVVLSEKQEKVKKLIFKIENAIKRKKNSGEKTSKKQEKQKAIMKNVC